ncbi:unnamed protein product [Boreogadus saida]
MTEPEDEDVDDGRFKFRQPPPHHHTLRFENGGVQNGGVQNGGVQNGGVQNGGVQNGGVQNAVAQQDQRSCLKCSGQQLLCSDTLFGEAQLGPSSTPFGRLIQDGQPHTRLYRAVTETNGMNGDSGEKYSKSSALLTEKLVNLRLRRAPRYGGASFSERQRQYGAGPQRRVSPVPDQRDGAGQREAREEEEGDVERRKRDNERKRNKVTKKVGQKGGTEGKTTF